MEHLENTSDFKVLNSTPVRFMEWMRCALESEGGLNWCIVSAEELVCALTGSENVNGKCLRCVTRNVDVCPLEPENECVSELVSVRL
ncbi:uncharacterized [Tachysurus ichikawai]